MAQDVGYYENNVTFVEGPFVVVFANGYRIEVELKGAKCPVLPDDSIYHYCKNNHLACHKEQGREPIARTVDILNQKVRDGQIVLHEKGYWYINHV